MAAKSRRGWWKNWSRALRVALGFGNSYQLMLKKNVKQPVPAVDFANSVASGAGGKKLYGTPTEYFTLKYREIFTDTKQAHARQGERQGHGRVGQTWNVATAPEFCAMVRRHQLWRSTGHLLSSDLPLVDPLVLHWYICNDVEKADQWYIQNGMIVNARNIKL